MATSEKNKRGGKEKLRNFGDSDTVCTTFKA